MNNELEIRKTALEILSEYENGEIPSHILLKKVLDKYDYLPTKDKAIISTIVKGVIERRIELDYIINLYSKTKTDKMKKVIRIIIEIGVYQIMYMDVYDTAAVNLSVNLAKKKGFTGLSGFVNGVLRSISSEKDSIKYPKEGTTEYISVKYSMPENVVSLLSDQYDSKTVLKICEDSLKNAELSVRLRNGLSVERQNEILKMFENGKISVRRIEGLDNVFKIVSVGDISKFDAFKKGEITVQDVSSVIMCENVPEGKMILDTCAAPGGKTMYLAEKYPDSDIVSCDISPDKLTRMNDNIIRAGVKNVKTVLWDATEFNPEWEEKFDVVIADVPCSGLGVIRKKQDIKYNVSEEKLNSLTDIQKRILDNVSRYVRKGGYLCYSTCTINKNENERQIERFLQESDFASDELRFVPQWLKDYASEGYVQLVQGINDTDGFFIAVLKKNG